MPDVLEIYRRFEKLPYGRHIFSRLVCMKAPYFKTIKPTFEKLRPGYCRVTMKKRKSVQNHIGSVHAIAMCNMAELTAGTLLEISLPKSMRWIPKGMNVQYLKVARTDLAATCEIDTNGIDELREFPMIVNVTDSNNIEVFRAVIDMHISPKH